MCGRENCASACVQVGVVSTHLVALTAVATDWVRNSDAATSAEKLEQDRSQTYRLMVTTSSLSSTHADSSCYLQTWVRCCRTSLLFCPFVVLPPVRVPFLPTSSPWRRTPPCWAWWPAWRWWWLQLQALWILRFCKLFRPIHTQSFQVLLQWRVNSVLQTSPVTNMDVRNLFFSFWCV